MLFKGISLTGALWLVYTLLYVTKYFSPSPFILEISSFVRCPPSRPIHSPFIVLIIVNRHDFLLLVCIYANCRLDCTKASCRELLKYIILIMRTSIYVVLMIIYFFSHLPFFFFFCILSFSFILMND